MYRSLRSKLYSPLTPLSLFCRYNIVFFLITYIVPLTLMAVCYSRMGFHLWGKKTIGEENETLKQNYQKKKKVMVLCCVEIDQKTGRVQDFLDLDTGRAVLNTFQGQKILNKAWGWGRLAFILEMLENFRIFVCLVLIIHSYSTKNKHFSPKFLKWYFLLY